MPRIPPSRSRSRSPSPTNSNPPPAGARSRSPPRKPKGNSFKSGGLRWKEKPRGEDLASERDHGLERGYRHSRDERRAANRGREAENKKEPLPATNTAAPPQADVPSPNFKEAERPKKDKKDREKKPPPAPHSNEPMIIVNVNDRLGTKASIPCLASDPIRLFKAQVAARIGRQPHEIMLKRQGERPMKDILTLEDYGVSNGVQLDLELDTGD